MKTVEDFLNEYKNLDKMSKEEIIDIVKKDRLEHLDSYKDYKKGKILNNANNRSIDILKGMLEYTYNNYKNNQALEVLDNVKLVAILFCIYADTIIIYNILFNRLSNLEIIDNANLNNKPRKEILEMLEKIQNINNIETIKSIFNENDIPQNFKNELLNYSTFLQANKLKTLQKENFKNEKLEKFYSELQKMSKKLIISFENNSDFSHIFYNFFDWFENDIYDIWHLSRVTSFDYNETEFKVYSVQEKFARSDKEKSKFGIAIKKNCDIKDLQFSLLERKLLILMNWAYISARGISETSYLSSMNLNNLLFKDTHRTISTPNAQKLNEAIDRLSRKYIYWELQNSAIANKLEDRNIVTGFSPLCDIQIIYNSKMHSSNDEGISKEIKGIIFNFNAFLKMRYQLKQIDKMPICFLQDTDYSLILAEYLIREMRIRTNNRISINKLLKNLFTYKKDLSAYETSIFAVIMEDSKNTSKRFKKFMETLYYVLEKISDKNSNNLAIVNSDGKRINKIDTISFNDVKLDNIFIKFNKTSDENQ